MFNPETGTGCYCYSPALSRANNMLATVSLLSQSWPSKPNLSMLIVSHPADLLKNSYSMYKSV